MRQIHLLTMILLSVACLASAEQIPTTQTTSAFIKVLVLDSRQPISDAKITWETNTHTKGSTQTDASGTCSIDNLSRACRWIVLHASKDQMVPLAIDWNAKPATDPANQVIPSFLFLMEPATKISGHLLDDSGKPITHGTVQVNVGKIYPGTDQQVDHHFKASYTDVTGAWSFDGIPTNPDTIAIGFFDRLHLTAEFFQSKEYKPRSALFDGTAKLMLPLCAPLQITVLKPDASPAIGAKVYLGRENNYVGNAIPPTKTDAKGETLFGCKPGMASVLTATLEGFGPAQTTFTSGKKPQSLTLTLTSPAQRSIEVDDSTGKPIKGAQVRVSTWHKNHVLPVRLETDAAGRAAWNSGPPDDITVNVFADGYLNKQDVLWPADQLTRITLSRPPTIAATVIDADTGIPLSVYTIRAAAAWAERESMVWQSVDWEPTNRAIKQPGKFQLQLDIPAYRWQFRVQADGYLPEDSELLDPSIVIKPLQFRLKRGKAVTGIVVTQDQQPLPGATVYLIGADESLGMLNDRIRPGEEDYCARTSTGRDGRFTFPPQKNDFALLVLSEQGTAIFKHQHTTTTESTLRIVPWAHLKGTVLSDGQPAPNVEIEGSADQITLGDNPIAGRQFHFKTDSNGKFEIPRIAAGHLVLSRQISNRSPGRMWYITLASLDINPSENVEITLGKGARVSGNLLIPAGKQWMVRQSRLEPKGSPHTPNWNNVEISEDGGFQAEGLQPGEYSLHIALHEFPPDNECGWGRLVAEFDKDITISSATDKVDIGALSPNELPAQDLKVGDLAPDFEVTLLDGKTLHLSDLKGKTVLLDFWAGWCAPCVAEIPNMQKIAAAHAADRSFVMLSLSQDDTEQDLRRLVKYSNLTWPQAWVGQDSPAVKAYAATAIPASFLIGPDGRIVARDLRGNDLTQAINSSLPQHR